MGFRTRREDQGGAKECRVWRNEVCHDGKRAAGAHGNVRRGDGGFVAVAADCSRVLVNFVRDTKRRRPVAMSFSGKTMNSRRMTGSFSGAAKVFCRGTRRFPVGANNFGTELCWRGTRAGAAWPKSSAKNHGRLFDHEHRAIKNTRDRSFIKNSEEAVAEEFGDEGEAFLGRGLAAAFLAEVAGSGDDAEVRGGRRGRRLRRPGYGPLLR